MLPSLSTPRLVLRPACSRDVGAFHALLQLPAVRRYLCDDRILLLETVAELLTRAESVAQDGLGLWCIAQAGRFIGLIGLQPVSETIASCAPDLAGQVEPTVALDPAIWGQGLASEALAAVLRHGFGTGLTAIAAVADVPNRASQAMLRRAGFRSTGEYQGPVHPFYSYSLANPDRP